MSDQPAQSPFRSRPFILAVIVVAVIALCAVVVLVGNLMGGKDDPAAPVAEPTSAAPTAPPAASDPDPSTCGLEGYEPTGTVDAVPDPDWALVGTVAAPSEPDGAGPGVVADSGHRSCYAHTPTGALFAAANIVAMGSDSSLGAEITEKSVVPGAGQKAAQAQLEQGTPSTNTVRYQIAGYSVLAYDGSTATVDIAVDSSGKMVSLVQTLEWSDGDWKVVLADTGQAPIPAAGLESLGGYTPWSGA
jgi:hypothetical protein